MDNELSRRRMVALSTIGGSAALLGAGATHALAAPPDAGRVPLTDPGGVRIGSAPVGGYSYLHGSWLDFQTRDLAPRVETITGTYRNSFGWLGWAVDLPAGAVVRDIEWYLSATVETSVEAYLWTSGNPYGQQVARRAVPAAAAGVRAVPLPVPASTSGPYAHGTKLHLFVYTDASRTINGARVGFTTHPAGTVLLPAPTRVYDSRSGAKIGNGQTRIHSLASYVPAGATAAIVNLSVTSGEKSGGMAVYNTGSSTPSGSALYFNGGTTVSNEIHVKLPSDRKVKATMRGVSGSKAHYFVDLVGYTV